MAVYSYNLHIVRHCSTDRESFRNVHNVLKSAILKKSVATVIDSVGGQIQQKQPFYGFPFQENLDELVRSTCWSPSIDSGTVTACPACGSTSRAQPQAT